VNTGQSFEQTINKESKSEGGIIGLTLRKSTMTRWLMTRHVFGQTKTVKVLGKEAG
jgi:hypothetical protein